MMGDERPVNPEEGPEDELTGEAPEVKRTGANENNGEEDSDSDGESTFARGLWGRGSQGRTG